jgi:hypothetical protein
MFNHFPDDVMQKIAMEIKKRFTSFITPLKLFRLWFVVSSIGGYIWAGVGSISNGVDVFASSACSYDIRWMTPSQELTLCGHGTFAAAYALYRSQRVPADAVISFYSQHALAKPLIVRQIPADSVVAISNSSGDVTVGELEMSLAAVATNPYVCSGDDLSIICGTLDLFSSEDIVAMEFAREILLVELKIGAFHLIPADATFLGFQHLANTTITKVVITCASSKHTPPTTVSTLATPAIADNENYRHGVKFDFCSRVVCLYRSTTSDSVTVVEDAATGSAHALLGPYWTRKYGMSALPTPPQNAETASPSSSRSAGESVVVTSLLAHQCSPRGAVIRTTQYAGAGNENHVFLGGKCHLYATSMLQL